MKRFVHRLLIPASLVVLAAISASCGSDKSSSVLAPSAQGSDELRGGKPGGQGGASSLWYAMVIDNNIDGVPSFRDTVTFVVQTTATSYPYVTLRCYQNGTLVSQDSNAMFANSLDRNFTLGPTLAWTGGAADCTANLENRDARNGRISVLASTSFPVN